LSCPCRLRRPEQLNRGTFFSNITNLASLPRDIQKKAPSSRARYVMKKNL
jgi:hypothetical protein